MRIQAIGTLITALALTAACGGSEQPVTHNPADEPAGAQPATPAGVIRSPWSLQGGAGGPEARAPSPNMVIQLKAANAAYSESELKAPAFAQISVILENGDKGISHSFSIYRTPNGEGPVFVGGLVEAQETRTFTFRTPEPGTYYFRDDLLPGLLHGTLEVE